MKRLILLFAAAAAVALSGCSKEDSDKGFTKAEKEVLAVLNGNFECKEYVGSVVSWHETMAFSTFSTPEDKLNELNDVRMEFHGTVNIFSDVGVSGYERDCYFQVSPDETRIIVRHIADDGVHYSAIMEEIYEYRIIDNNTIKLRDVKYFNWYTFIRK